MNIFYMHIFKFFLFFLLAIGAFSEEVSITSGKTILDNLEGIVILGDIKDFKPDGVINKKRLAISIKLNLQRETLRANLKEFLDKPLTIQNLEEIKKIIFQSLNNKDSQVVIVKVPEQIIDNNTLQIVAFQGNPNELKTQNQILTIKELLDKSLIPTADQNTEQILIDNLKGIIILGSKNFSSENENITNDPSLKNRLNKFLGTPITPTQISKIESEISNYFAENNINHVQVNIPEQDITSNIIQVIVSKDLALIEEEIPRLPTPPGEENPQILDHLDGIMITDDTQKFSPEGIEGIKGVTLLIKDLPGDDWDKRDLNEKLQSFVGKPLTKRDLNDIKKIILKYFKDHGRPVIIVSTPEQDISYNSIQLVITQSKLGKVKIQKSRWTKEKTLRSYLTVKPDTYIDQNILSKNLDAMNRVTFRRTDAIYTPGEKPGTTDIELITKDQKPFRLYVGGENTGTGLLGEMRWLTGFNWLNFLGIDDVLSFQFTTSNDFTELQAFSASYILPVWYKHFLNIFGGYSRTRAPIPPATTSDSKGESKQVSLRYTIPFTPKNSFHHEFVAGFDFKRTNTITEFVENLPPDSMPQTANLTQFLLSYLAYCDYKNYISGKFDIFFSPIKMLPDESNARYNSLRQYAKSRYVYGKVDFKYVKYLPESCSLMLRLRGQLSSANLLPSEQEGLGGYDSVRGYEERQVNADNALIVNAEARAACFNLFGTVGREQVKDQLTLLAFADYGIGCDHKRIEGEPKYEWLLGVGPGLRYTMGQYFSARVDWGIQLHRNDFGGEGQRIHIGVLVSF